MSGFDFGLLPEDHHVRNMAASMGPEKLNPLLEDPAVVRDLNLLLTARGAVKLGVIARLQSRGFYPAGEIEGGADRKRVLDAKGKPYSQGLPRPEKPELVYSYLEDIEETDEQWLWHGRIPTGTPTVLLGRQGDGKSTFLGWLASRVNTGAPWPDCPDDNEPGSVVLLQAEESRGSKVRKRGNAFGFTHGKFVVVDGVKRHGSVDFVNLHRDCEQLADLCNKLKDVRLIIVDPLSSYMSDISGYNSNEVRAFLQPVYKLAEDLDTAVVMTVHPNKNKDNDILDRASGSGAITQMARAAWFLSEDPRDPSRRMLSLIKANLDEINEKAIAFHYEKRTRAMTFLPELVDMKARRVDHLLQKAAAEEKITARPGPDPTAARKAQDFLLGLLQNGPHLQSAAQDLALNQGIKESSFRKGLAKLVKEDGRVSRERRGSDGRWWLVLSADRAAREGPENPDSGAAPRGADDPHQE